METKSLGFIGGGRITKIFLKGLSNGNALVSAMLPTYFWFQWNKIENLGEQMGLSASESKETIHQTLLAAIDLYFNSGLSIEEINDLIPAKPIGEHESQISEIYQTKLIGLYQKIKP